jgi:hypothetical protein
MRTQRSIVDIFLLVMVQSMYVRNKSSLGDMHTSKRKNKGHKILHGSAKAYIHEAHPHSTHTMKSIITIVKNYLSQLSQFSHFSTWHSTPLVDPCRSYFIMKTIRVFIVSSSLTNCHQLPPTKFTNQVHQLPLNLDNGGWLLIW